MQLHATTISYTKLQCISSERNPVQHTLLSQNQVLCTWINWQSLCGILLHKLKATDFISKKGRWKYCKCRTPTHISGARNRSRSPVSRTDFRQQYPLTKINTPFMFILLVHTDMLIRLQQEKGRGAGRWQTRTNTDNGKRKEKGSTDSDAEEGTADFSIKSKRETGKQENLLSLLSQGDTRSNDIKQQKHREGIWQVQQ